MGGDQGARKGEGMGKGEMEKMREEKDENWRTRVNFVYILI